MIAISSNFMCRNGHDLGQFFLSSAVSEIGGNCMGMSLSSSEAASW